MATKARKDSRGYALKKGESQRKDGRYVFRYTTIRGEQKAVYAKELSELRKKEVKIRRAIEDGLDPDRAERITLNELFDEYISQKYDLKQSTLTNYKYMYNHYVRVDFGKRRISKIKYTDVKKFYYSLIMEKGFKPNSMEIVNTLLHPTFTMAVRDGLLRLNPTEGVMTEIKKSHSWEKKKRHALTIPEQKAFTNYIANSEEYRGWYPLFTVMLGTGCRIGEVLGLRWQDIDFKNRTISINHNLVYRVQEDGSCTNHVNSPKTSAGIRIIPMQKRRSYLPGFLLPLLCIAGALCTKKFAAPLTERRTCSDRLRSAVLSRQRAGHRRLRASSSATSVQSGCSCRMEPGHSGVTGPDTTALTAFALARPLATTSTLQACMMVLMPMV